MILIGFMFGFPLGWAAAIAWQHYLALLYEPPPLPDTTQEAADEWIRGKR